MACAALPQYWSSWSMHGCLRYMPVWPPTWFFIVAGFTIAQTYESALQAGELGFHGYALQRLARLYPLVMLAACARGGAAATAPGHASYPLCALHQPIVFTCCSLLALVS